MDGGLGRRFLEAVYGWIEEGYEFPTLLRQVLCWPAVLEQPHQHALDVLDGAGDAARGVYSVPGSLHLDFCARNAGPAVI